MAKYEIDETVFSTKLFEVLYVGSHGDKPFLVRVIDGDEMSAHNTLNAASEAAKRYQATEDRKDRA